MKHTLILSLLFIASAAFAQLNLPELSPRSKIVEEVGYTKIIIQYGRPSARGRKIFGELTPYDRLWRTGAGKSTWLTFCTEVFINNKRVPAGSYALVSIPGVKEWTVMLSTDTATIYGDPSEYDVAEEAVKLTVKPEKTDHFYESLTIYLDQKKYDAELYLAWENTQIHFPIITKSHQKSIESIEAALKRNPNDIDALNEAAYYYSMNNENQDQVLSWLDHALSVKEESWTYQMKIEIYEKRKNFVEARKTAEKAIVYLKREKPDGDAWLDRVSYLEGKMKSWPK